MPPPKKRTLLILPAVLLTINLVEYVAAYKARQHVRDAHLRVALTLVLVGFAFAAGAEWVTPWLQRVLTKTGRDSHRHAGTVGLLLFYVVVYGGLYYAYYVVERHGAGSLLPRALR
jgi:hypothetical protein